MSFADLGLSDELLKAVAEAGYTEPTPIQAQAIPSVLMMRDIIGIAQTGTGKTASFVLPMIDILAHGRRRALMPRSLILEPTRELAAQVAENFEKYGKNHDLKMALLIGGVQMGDQVKALDEGVDVLIATPGRLMDLFERGKILLTGCSLLVIDEADRMLDMGFIPDIEHICTKLPATAPDAALLGDHAAADQEAGRQVPHQSQVDRGRPPRHRRRRTSPSSWSRSRSARSATCCASCWQSEGVESAIIFCNRKTMVRELNKSLQRHGFKSGEIHGDIDQSSRIAELDRFKCGEINMLVASDVAARGLDIKGVSHVFNFDAPWHPDDYVHRIGRTGRAGATGRAFTFVTRSDAEAIANIEKLIGNKIERVIQAAAWLRPKNSEAAAPGQARESRTGTQISDRPRDEARPERKPAARSCARRQACRRGAARDRSSARA